MTLTIHLIGVCGTAMATLAALLKSKGHDVRGSDQNVYPPMSDFLAAAGHHRRCRATAPSTSPRRSTWSSSATRSRAATSELEEVLDRKIRYCSLPEAVRDHFLWGLAVDRDRRHAREDHDHVAGRLAAGARRRRSERLHRRHRRELRGQLPDRRRPRVRHRRGRVRQRVLRQDREVPEVPAGHRRRQQHRVRSRRHLSGPRRRSGWRSGASSTSIPRRGLLLLGADNAGGARAEGARSLPRSRRSGVSDGSALAGARSAASPAHRRRSACGAAATPIGSFELPLLGAYNVRNALAAIAVGAAVGLNTDTMAQGLRHSRACGAGWSFAAPPRRRGLRRLRASPDGDCRDARGRPLGVSRTDGSGRSSSRDRPHPAGASFSRSSRARSATADRVILPGGVPVERCPKSERLSAEQLVADLQARGVDARYIPQVDDIVQNVAKRQPERRPGRRHVERRLRRHPPEAAGRAGGARHAGDCPRPKLDDPVRIAAAGDSALVRRAAADGSIRPSTIAPARSRRRSRTRWEAIAARRRRRLLHGHRLFRSLPGRARVARAGNGGSRARGGSGAAAYRALWSKCRCATEDDSRRTWPRSRRSRGCSRRRSIALHAAGTYRVYMVGFVPGFAYLAEVDPADRRAAACRRRARTCRPARWPSPAAQTGIYPAVTPGGWNIIGRTRAQAVRSRARRAIPLRPGDTRQVRPHLAGGIRVWSGLIWRASGFSGPACSQRSRTLAAGVPGRRRPRRRPDGRVFPSSRQSPRGQRRQCGGAGSHAGRTGDRGHGRGRVRGRGGAVRHVR